jgi:hypothetical protein
MTADAVPWIFTDEPGLLQWAWVTDHFMARISAVQAGVGADGQRLIRSMHWELADRMRLQQGVPRLLIEGDARSFDEAESALREHVAKCYDPRLGYRRYAGALAFTFELSSGERVDVSRYIGREVTVTVLQAGGERTTVRGDFDVSGYRWRVRGTDSVFDVVPEHAVSISDRSVFAQEAEELVRPASYSGVGRIYREDPRPGCTGTPGFLSQTVDHAGRPRCPLHERDLPDHVLH